MTQIENMRTTDEYMILGRSKRDEITRMVEHHFTDPGCVETHFFANIVDSSFMGLIFEEGLYDTD